MSKNNRFLPLILAVALGGAGPADIQAAVTSGAEIQDRTLFRLVTDRLSVLYLMSGRTDDAVRLQKETMNMAGKPVPTDLVRSRGEELVNLLDEDFKEDEAAKFRAQLREAGIEIGSPSAPAVVAKAPAPIAVSKPEPVIQTRPAYTKAIPVISAAKPAPVSKEVVEEETVVVKQSATPRKEPGMAVVKVRRQSDSRQAEAPAAAPAPKAAPLAPVFLPAQASRPVPHSAPAPTVRLVTPPDAQQPLVNAPTRSKSPAPVGRVIVEETVTVEEEVMPPAEPKRAVVKVRRVQTPIAPPPVVSAPVVATASAKIAKKTYLTVPRAMVVPVKKTATLQSQPLFPKKAKPVPVVVPESDQPIKSVSLAPKRDNALRDLSSIKVSLEFRDVQLADLVRLLANKANLNMVSKNPISGQTTVNFQDIPIGTALDTVLKTNGYSYEVRDGVVWVYRAGEEPLETRVFFLRHAMAYEILPIVENTLQQLDSQPDEAASLLSAPRSSSASKMEPSAGAPAGETAPAGAPAAGAAGGAGTTGGTAPAPAAGGAPAGETVGQSAAGSGSTAAAVSAGPRVSASGRWSIQADERSNSLIVLAPRPKLDEIARLLEVFDVSMENRQMQERIFKLKYINRNTLVKAIQMVLPRFDPDKQMLQVQRVDAGAAGSGMGGSGGSSGSSGGGM